MRLFAGCVESIYMDEFINNLLLIYRSETFPTVTHLRPSVYIISPVSLIPCVDYFYVQ